jgi:ferredoxin
MGDIRPLKLTVDRDVCCGSGLCVGVAPTLFDIAPDGAVRILKDALDEADYDLAAQAVGCCPLNAIRLDP